MADKGIIFSASMVLALLAGRKAQTRRLFKPRGFRFYTHPVSGDRYEEFNKDGMTGGGPMQAFGWGEGLYAYLPYAPGDRLYVREAWCSTPAYDDLSPAAMGGEEPLRYLADDATFNWAEADGAQSGRRRASFHMPRWASRITLAVTDVRVQRLMAITEADAVAEGIYSSPGTPLNPNPAWRFAEDGPHFTNDDDTGARDVYFMLWDTLHKDVGERAVDDPWVVAVSFDVAQRNIDAEGEG